MKSTNKRYGPVAVTLHWLVAIIVLVMIGSGFSAARALDPTDKIEFLRLHLPLGILVLTLMVVRLGWWLFVDYKPAPAPMPKWQHALSKTIHWLLYMVVFGMAASGIGMIILSGAGPIIAGDTSAALPDFWGYLPRTPHGIGARVLLVLFFLHAGAALYHQFIKRDGLIKRMWYTR